MFWGLLHLLNIAVKYQNYNFSNKLRSKIFFEDCILI